LNMINTLKVNKRPKRKMFGSYKAYENSRDQERADTRIYQYTEASDKHLRLIRKRLNKERRFLMQKKVAVLTACAILGGFGLLIILY
jgi:hypothetical protein